MKSEVTILGTTYKIIWDDAGKDPKLEDALGYCELWAKEIHIDTQDKSGDKGLVIGYAEALRNKVVRHEIVHAFLQESGLGSRSLDEELVDWIAIQLPKIAAAVESLGVMG